MGRRDGDPSLFTGIPRVINLIASTLVSAFVDQQKVIGPQVWSVADFDLGDMHSGPGAAA